MRFNLKHSAAVIGIVVMLLSALPGFATRPQEKSIVASANGEGLLKMGKEEFKVTAVVAKLKDDGTVEINLVSEITVFISGTWATTGSPKEGVTLEITGGATKGALEGSGKLFLSDDRKSIQSLTLQVINKNTKRDIAVNFTGK